MKTAKGKMKIAIAMLALVFSLALIPASAGGHWATDVKIPPIFEYPSDAHLGELRKP